MMKPMSAAQEKLIRQLHSRQGRKKSRFLLVEGLRSIKTMLEAKILPEFIAVSTADLTNPGREFLSELESRNARLFETDPRRFALISNSVESQGFIAITPESQLPDPSTRWPEARLIAYLDELSDPGNVGAIIRTAAACKADLVAVSPGSADILNPKVIRATAGAIFRLPVARIANLETFFAQLQSNNIVLIGSDARAEISVDELEIDANKLCLAYGSEATGLSRQVRENCARLFRIRSAPEVESFNVAAAAAITLHDIARRMELI